MTKKEDDDLTNQKSKPKFTDIDKVEKGFIARELKRVNQGEEQENLD